MRVWIALTLLLAAAVAAQPEGGFDSGDLEPGDTYVKQFKQVYQEGYTYHCHQHPWMEAMVHVAPDMDGASVNHEVRIVEGANTDDWGYEPEHLYIEAGDTITWENTGGSIHTVTAFEGSHDGHDHGAHDDGHDHDHDHGASQDSPAGLVALVALLAALAMARRRA